MTESNKSKKSTVKRVVSIVETVLIVLLLAFICYLVYCNISGRLAFVGKYAVVRIISESMEPTIPKNEYILVKKIEPEEVKVKDVIVFISRDPSIYGFLNTHRVIEIKGETGNLSFATKGDNNKVADTLATKQSDLRGIYIKSVPLITKIANLFANKVIFALVIIVPSLVLVFFGVYDVKKKSKAIKMEMLIEQEVERLKREGVNGENKKAEDVTSKDNNSDENKRESNDSHKDDGENKT